MTSGESENYVKFDPELIVKKLQKLIPGKSPGPDGIRHMLLKTVL